MSGENERLIRRLVSEVWNQGKLDLADELVDPDYVRHDPAWPEEILGRQGFKEYVATMRQAFSDGQVTIEDLIAAGDKVVTRWTVRGTHQGDYLGIRPTGRKIALHGISINRVEGGRVAEAWDGYDASGLMQQLGVVP